MVSRGHFSRSIFLIPFVGPSEHWDGGLDRASTSNEDDESDDDLRNRSFAKAADSPSSTHAKYGQVFGLFAIHKFPRQGTKYYNFPLNFNRLIVSLDG